ncbi:MAG: hypothetical protein IMY85_05005, partial [Chloroflexi bacterium]|nr:hypothetical protein [Chloroflexota bacterium]
MTLKVHYFTDPQANTLEVLRSNLGTGIQLSTGKEIPHQAAYQVLINGTPTRQHLDASPHLNTLIIPYAGVPEATRNLLPEYPQLKVYNLHHNAAPTA